MARLSVRLTPKGGADRIEGWGIDAQGRPILKARVSAAPTDGQANAAIMALLGGALGIPKSNVMITRGAASRVKAFEIEGLSQDDLRARLQGPA